MVKELNKYNINLITIFNDNLFELIKSKFKANNVSYQAYYDGEKVEKNKKLIYLKKEDLEYVKIHTIMGTKKKKSRKHLILIIYWDIMKMGN